MSIRYIHTYACAPLCLDALVHRTPSSNFTGSLPATSFVVVRVRVYNLGSPDIEQLFETVDKAKLDAEKIRGLNLAIGNLTVK
jgi:hypothetical protein